MSPKNARETACADSSSLSAIVCWSHSPRLLSLDALTRANLGRLVRRLRVCLRVRSPMRLLCLCLVLEMLAGFAQEFSTRDVETAILCWTPTASRHVDCVAALLIRPRKVTQMHIIPPSIMGDMDEVFAFRATAWHATVIQ